MKLPQELVISEDKLSGYLLAHRARNDKSGFLARAGYTLANWRVLEHDIRRIARTGDATASGSTPFGDMFVVRGELRGPNGGILKVKPVWIKLADSGEVRFVTLVPDEETAP